MTQDDLDRKTGQMVREAKTLKKRLAYITDELTVFATSWKELGRLCSGSPRWCFELGKEALSVQNPSQNNVEIANIPWAHLDRDNVKRLIFDYQETTLALDAIRQRLTDIAEF